MFSLGIFLIVVYVIAVAVLIWAAILMVRNNKVFTYRAELLDKIAHAARDDAEYGADWRWRFDVFHTVEYEDMVHQFWRPLDTFYPDKAFITPGVPNPALFK